MTAETINTPPRAANRLKPFQAFTFLGLAIVLLPTSAALLAGAMGNVQVPPKLSEAATATHFWLVFSAIPLAMVQIALPKGTINHRLIGYAWCSLLIVSAIISFAMRELNDGGFSPPHAFSILTLIMVPLIVYFARSHRVGWHRGIVLSLCLIMVFAGVLTFIPGRAIGTMFWDMFA